MGDEIGLLHDWIDAHQHELVEAVRGAIKIPSKKQAGEPGAPYGQPIREALNYTLQHAEHLGFKVADVDGHAGHAEFGQGAEMIAALGHLDVVPEGDRWSHDPYGAEVVDGYIYGRGASDDKGPLFAALYGAKALMECGLPLQRRVRLIFGCDEESGFGCVNQYWNVAQQERPLYAFTPDADFPLIFAEKGISTLTIERALTSSPASLRVLSASGGRRANMVPDSAEARIVGDAAELYTALRTLLNYWDRNVQVTADAEGLTVRATGKSAHGATPELGDNAVARLARALLELDLPADHDWLQWTASTVDTTGAALNVQGRDDVAGPLTNNLGILAMSQGMVRLTYNFRYPVTWNADELPNRLLPTVKEAGWTVVGLSDSRPLYVPLDQEPVATLLSVYREETQDYTTKPATTGGGTYARATPNAVAFGPGFPGSSDGPAHEPDERIAIESLVRAAKIYAHAFYKLAR